jgi:protein-disulfide isomerase
MLKEASNKKLALIGFATPLCIAFLVYGAWFISTKLLGTSNTEHVLGNNRAPVTLVEYSDFQCPFCKRHYPVLKQVLANYKNKVRIIYKHFPLSNIHPLAQKAAEASECASEQGKFWEMHDKIFENQESLSLDALKQWAKDLKLDSNKFNSCLDSGTYAQKVQQDYQEGVTKGVQGTPATFVNGQLISGAVPYENFSSIIDQLLK